jgi:hypothetical protein
MSEAVNIFPPRREIANCGNDDVRNDPDWSAGSLRDKYPFGTVSFEKSTSATMLKGPISLTF